MIIEIRNNEIIPLQCVTPSSLDPIKYVLVNLNERNNEKIVFFYHDYCIFKYVSELGGSRVSFVEPSNNIKNKNFSNILNEVLDIKFIKMDQIRNYAVALMKDSFAIVNIEKFEVIYRSQKFDN